MRIFQVFPNALRKSIDILEPDEQGWAPWLELRGVQR